MLKHNLKLAWRQLMKYRLQSLLSLIGLAVGFTCFALSSLWWRYETTYDCFHPDAERIYVGMMSLDHRVTVQPSMPFLAGSKAKESIPEVELTTTTTKDRGKLEDETELVVMTVDTAFFDLFRPELVAGSYPKMQPDGNEMVLTDRQARRLFGTTDCIGRQVKMENAYEWSNVAGTYTVAAVVKDWMPHTGFPFECLLPYKAAEIAKEMSEGAAFSFGYNTFFRLHSTANPDTVSAKLNRIMKERVPIVETWITPITSFHYDYQESFYSSFVRIGHIRIFALLGGLVIVCALFNYLSLYIIRVRTRARELALRLVCGSSQRQLLGLLTTEFMLLIAAAWGLGLLFLHLSLPEFKEITHIQEESMFFYREMTTYLLVVTAVTLPLMLGVTWWVKHRSLNSVLRKGAKAETPVTRHLFRRMSLLVQLGVSMGLMLATTVIVMQLHYLRTTTDTGFCHERRVSLSYETKGNMPEALYRFLDSHPDVEEVRRYCNAIHRSYSHWIVYNDDHTRKGNIVQKNISREDADFWGLELLAGEWMPEGEKDVAMLNESAVKYLNLYNPVDTFIPELRKRVTGVVRNVAAKSLIVPQEPVMYVPKGDRHGQWGNVSFSYRPGTWKALSDSIQSLYQREGQHLNFQNMEESFNELLTSEDTLQKLFYVMTGACILIALFGVYSLISISCEQRRKEIAIRKVHGATIKDILAMFFAEQVVTLLVAALVAFPAAYLCIKPWLEGYIHQVEIPLWLCPALFLLVALLVALCIGWRVWKTANARPADEICKG